VVKSKGKKHSVSKERSVNKTRMNESRKPVTVQTFIMRLFNIKRVGHNPASATVFSEDEVERSVDQRGSNVFSNQPAGSQDFSDDEASSIRWRKEDCWPQKIWNECKDVDPHLLFDGRKRDGCREIMIANQPEERSNQLNSYIWHNIETTVHETQLPCILNSNFFKTKL
jgi:hypothetical protein